MDDRFAKQKVAVRHKVRYDYVESAAAGAFLTYPRENCFLAAGHQISLQGATQMFYDVGCVRRQEALRYECDVQRSALQFDIQEINQLVHADGVGPHGTPETGRPEIRIVARVNVPVDHEHLVSLLDQPLQRYVIESGRDRAQFPAKDLSYPVYETMMILFREGVEVLEVQDNDLVRMRGEPVGHVHERLADLRAVQTVEEVYVTGSRLRGNAQIQISNPAVELLLDIIALCNRPI